MSIRTMAAVGILVTILSFTVVAVEAASSTDWVERSNANTRILNTALAKYSPETAAMFGIDGYDAEVTRIWPDNTAAALADLAKAEAELAKRLADERDPAVRQDLEILIEFSRRTTESIRLNDELSLPYQDVPQLMFRGFLALLDDQVPAERRASAVLRLRKYAGMEKGTTPITEQAIAMLRHRLKNPALRGPFAESLRQDIANSERFMAGIGQLFQKYEIAGHEEPYAALQAQVRAYNEFLEAELMPRTTTDYRLPEKLYRHNLVQVGVDMPVEELVSRAKVSFREIQNEMQSLAKMIAEKRGLPSSDYRDVIRELKKEQLTGDAILVRYREVLATLEAIVEKKGVVSLPERDAIIRLATEAEAAATPAPHVKIPRLLGNTGQMAEFVLPLRIPSTDGSADVSFDDFNFDAAAWTLTVHEARPGHELQISSVIEKGVSEARALYALNSTNVEGWALYMEAEMKPEMPLEGQLISLQHRLMRAARAILDPSLQLGWVERDEARRVLEREVVLSPAMAQQEVERYTFRYPGQATSYFVGYSRLMEMRTDAERILGDRFDRRKYHDFILAQGVLPPALLRKAVLQDFVKQ
jgi:uncharacterized protein (DUF885 family)